MTEFKIGDRVRVVAFDELKSDDFKIGDTGTVASIWNDDTSVPFPYWVNFDGDEHNHIVSPKEIELWFEESDTTAEQDAIDMAYASGYDDGYAQGFDDGIEMEH